MGIRLALRYDMRAPAFGAPAADLYPAAVEQCAIADGAGFDTVFLAEHHGAEDGYLPVTDRAGLGDDGPHEADDGALLGAAPGAPQPDACWPRTSPCSTSISGGRVELTLGIGYRLHEYEMFGVEKSKRVKILEETIGILERAWSGEPFEYEGMTVQILPTPVQKPRPPIYIGGSTEASAIRAARYGDDFMPATPQLYDVYAAEMAAPRQAGASAAAAEGSAVPVRDARSRAQLGHRRPARDVHDELQRRMGQGAWRRRHAVPADRDGRRAEGQAAVRRRHAGGLRRASSSLLVPTPRSRCTR